METGMISSLLSIDLAAEACGWASVELQPDESIVRVRWTSGVVSTVKTRIKVLDAGTLRLHRDKCTATLLAESTWLDMVRLSFRAFLEMHPARHVCYEFPRWLRGKGETSTRGLLTTVSLRSALLMALSEFKPESIHEISPDDWQRGTIGARGLTKQKSLAAAEQRLGFIAANHNESDAALMGAWKLLMLAAEGERSGQE